MKSKRLGFESILTKHISDFLAAKRASGRRFDAEEHALGLLDRYLFGQEIRSLEEITSAVIDSFLISRPRPMPRSYNHLLCTVSRLFEWMVTQERIERSPVQAKYRRQASQRIPFIFDLSRARLLLQAAVNLSDNSKAPARGKTYHAMFAILYGLGLRVGEVCRLRVADVDFERHLLLVRKTKFYKDRIVPFGPRMEKLLQEFLNSKIQRLGNISPEAPMFSFTKGKEIHPCTVSQTFHALIPMLGLNRVPGISSPHLHDLRHSFAVGTLLRWYKTKKSIGSELLKLSTFMGHVDVSSTAVYLNITESLLREANMRFEDFARPVLQEIPSI